MSDKLATGMDVFEDRHCGRGVPVVSQQVEGIVGELIGDQLFKQINDMVFPLTQNTQPPAPACRKQAPHSFQGLSSQYPHVQAQPAP
jgi:hypothetical protein